MKAPQLLLKLVHQFMERHRRQPQYVVVTPEALAALAIKATAFDQLSHLPVSCRPLRPEELTNGDDAIALGVTVVVSPDFKTATVQGCSLKA